MTYFDLALLNLIEWSCRKFQVLTGKTNVWLAIQLTNLSIIVYFVWALLGSWTGGVAYRILVAAACGALLYVLTQTIFKVPIEVYEDHAYHRVAKGLRNPRRIRDALLRISFLMLSLVVFLTISFVLYYPPLLVFIRPRLNVILLGYLLIVLTTVVLYLLACDPLPPCPGKLKVWLRGLAPSRVAASESTPP